MTLLGDANNNQSTPAAIFQNMGTTPACVERREGGRVTGAPSLSLLPSLPLLSLQKHSLLPLVLSLSWGHHRQHHFHCPFYCHLTVVFLPTYCHPFNRYFCRSLDCSSHNLLPQSPPFQLATAVLIEAGILNGSGPRSLVLLSTCHH